MPRRFLILPLILAALLIAVIVNAPRRTGSSVEAAGTPSAQAPAEEAPARGPGPAEPADAASAGAAPGGAPPAMETPEGPADGAKAPAAAGFAAASDSADAPPEPAGEGLALPVGDLDGEPEDDTAVELPPAAALAGLELRVREPSGEPVPGARVQLRPAGAPWAEGELIEADPEGRVRFAGLAPGSFEARLESAGFLLSPESFPLADAGAHLEVDLGPGETRSFTLEAPARARALVHLVFGGRPLGGARLELAPRPGAGAHAPVGLEADGEGRAQLPALPAGAWRLKVEHRLLSDPLRLPMELRPGRSDFAPALEPAEVAGTLRDGAGRPVVGAEVWVEGPWRARRLGRAGELVVAAWPEEGLQPSPVERAQLGGGLSDARGFYLLTGILPGPGLELVVEAPGFAPLRRPLDLVPAASRRLDLGLAPGAALTVELVDAEGRPLAGAWLKLETDGGKRARLAVTDREGRVRFPSLAPGTYRVTPAEGSGAEFPERELVLAVGEDARLVLKG